MVIHGFKLVQDFVHPQYGPESNRMLGVAKAEVEFFNGLFAT